MKILYVDRNHSCCLGDNPRVVMFTDSSMSRNGRPLFLPPFAGKWCMKIGVALRVSRLGKFIGERFASRYYDALAPVVRLVPLDAAGDETSAALTSFDGSIVVGDWMPVDDLSDAGEISVTVNGCIDEKVSFSDLAIDRLISMLSGYFTLKMGDMIVPANLETTLTPVIDDRVTVGFNGVELLNIRIK